MNFENLGLSETTIAAVKEAGFSSPTPIQAQAIPAILAGDDIFGCAQTGTGKTASFALPILDVLHKGRAKARLPRALVLVPTRELAQQVFDNFEGFGRNHRLKMALIVGGESMVDQEKRLASGVDIIIATPGRLVDVISKGKLLMSGIQYVVLDEADRMLDMGFIPDVDKILSYVRQKHQTLFFSATASKEILRLTKSYLKNPVEISITPQSSSAQNIEQFSIKTLAKDKRKVLRALIAKHSIDNAIIFCNRKIDVNALTSSLKRHKMSAAAMHGDLQQSERTKTLEDFKQKNINFLIASDVAARGIDIEELPYVINFDVPSNAEEYVHRIGRTGRAGKLGKAYTLFTDKDIKQLKAIESLMNKKLTSLELEAEVNKEEPNESIKNPDVSPVEVGSKSKKNNDRKVEKHSVTERKDQKEKKPKLPVYGFGSETPNFFNLNWM